MPRIYRNKEWKRPSREHVSEREFNEQVAKAKREMTDRAARELEEIAQQANRDTFAEADALRERIDRMERPGTVEYVNVTRSPIAIHLSHFWRGVESVAKVLAILSFIFVGTWVGVYPYLQFDITGNPNWLWFYLLVLLPISYFVGVNKDENDDDS